MYIRERTTKHGEAGTPYYVGKGHGNRAFNRHHRVTTPTDIARIIFAGRDMFEYDAHQLEMLLIRLHGRLDNGTGCLANLTDGGEGKRGAVMTPENKEKLRQRMIGKRYALGHVKTPEDIARHVAQMRGRKMPPRSEVWRLKHSEAIRGRKHSAETKAKIGLAHLGRPKAPHTEESKVRIRAARALQKNVGHAPCKYAPCKGCGTMLTARQRSTKCHCGSSNRKA